MDGLKAFSGGYETALRYWGSRLRHHGLVRATQEDENGDGVLLQGIDGFQARSYSMRGAAICFHSEHAMSTVHMFVTCQGTERSPQGGRVQTRRHNQSYQCHAERSEAELNHLVPQRVFTPVRFAQNHYGLVRPHKGTENGDGVRLQGTGGFQTRPYGMVRTVAYVRLPWQGPGSTGGGWIRRARMRAARGACRGPAGQGFGRCRRRVTGEPDRGPCPADVQTPHGLPCRRASPDA